MRNIVALVGLRHPQPRQPDQQRDDLRATSSRGTSAASTTRSTRSPRAINGKLFGMKDAVGVRLQPARDPRARHHGRRRDRTCRTAAARTMQHVRGAGAGVRAGGEPAAGGGRRAARTSAPTCRRSTCTVDRAAAKARGVKLTDLFGTLQALLSTLYINDFNLYGRTYRVQAEAQAQFRQTPEDIGRLYVRGANDAMIPLSALTRDGVPQRAHAACSRFNGFTSALVTGTPKPGRSTGELMDAAGRADRARSSRRRGSAFAYSGQSYQERASSGAAALVFGLGLVHRVPRARRAVRELVGAVRGAARRSVRRARARCSASGCAALPSDIYFQVGLITVVGLAAKNAILIVEFANELRDAAGARCSEAAVEAARERFRPILMTSFAFILGVRRCVIASGAGAASRHSIGTGVFAGMLVATTIGIFFIPLFFRLIRRLAERGSAAMRRRSRRAPLAASRSPSSLARLRGGAVVSCPSRWSPAETKGARRHASDSARAFFDSLARRARGRLGAGAPIAPLPPRRVAADSIADLAWLDILTRHRARGSRAHRAPAESRPRGRAQARIREFRAEVGVAAAPLFPSVSLNASGVDEQGRHRLVPADRRTMRAASPATSRGSSTSGARRGAACRRRAPTPARRRRRSAPTVLSLVSDVASGYLDAARARSGARPSSDARWRRARQRSISRGALRIGPHLGARRAAVRGAGGRARRAARARASARGRRRSMR